MAEQSWIETAVRAGVQLAERFGLLPVVGAVMVTGGLLWREGPVRGACRALWTDIIVPSWKQRLQHREDLHKHRLDAKRVALDTDRLAGEAFRRLARDPVQSDPRQSGSWTLPDESDNSGL